MDCLPESFTIKVVGEKKKRHVTIEIECNPSVEQVNNLLDLFKIPKVKAIFVHYSWGITIEYEFKIGETNE